MRNAAPIFAVANADSDFRGRINYTMLGLLAGEAPPRPYDELVGWRAEYMRGNLAGTRHLLYSVT